MIVALRPLIRNHSYLGFGMMLKSTGTVSHYAFTSASGIVQVWGFFDGIKQALFIKIAP